MATFRGELADIPRLISVVAAGHNPRIQEESLRTLLYCLSKLGINFKLIHEAVAGTRVLPRCTRIYRDVDNGSNVCVIRHEFPFVAVSQDGTPQNKHYRCCGLVTPASPDSEDTDGGVYATSGRTRGSTTLRPSWLQTRFQVQIQDQASLRDPQCQPQTSPPSTPFPPHPTPPSPPASRAQTWATLPVKPHPQRLILLPSPPRNPRSPLAATLANPGHFVPVPGPVDHTPMMADAHPQAAQWWTEPPPPCAFPLPSGWSSSMHGHTNAETEADAMRVPPPQILVLITTIPWQESSLYHPPGWVQVLAALRDDPPARPAGAEVETEATLMATEPLPSADLEACAEGHRGSHGESFFFWPWAACFVSSWTADRRRWFWLFELELGAPSETASRTAHGCGPCLERMNVRRLGSSLLQAAQRASTVIVRSTGASRWFNFAAVHGVAVRSVAYEVDGMTVYCMT